MSPRETKGGYFYSPKDNKVFVSTNARFLEDDHIRNHKSNNKIVLEELDTDEIGDSIKYQNDEIIVNQPVIRSETTRIEEHLILLCRSGRVVRQPDRYMGLGNALVAISDDNKDDPLTLSDVKKDVDFKAWQLAMDLEMGSMYSNQVWELVYLPEGVKPIGCKWIYKRKRGANGRVETYKARLPERRYRL